MVPPMPTADQPVETHRPVVTVRLAGDYDLEREHELLEHIALLDLPPWAEVRLDMSAVDFVDSSGLRGLLTVRAYLDGRGCRLRLLQPNRQVRRVIEITSLDQILTMLDPDGDGRPPN